MTGSSRKSYGGCDDDLYNEKRLRNERKEIPLWDSFQDPPPKNTSGSLASAKRFDLLIKIFKVFVYLIVFSVIIISTVLTKTAFLLITAHLMPNTLVRYCDIRQPNRELYAVIPEIQTINWIWILIFSFAAPEVFTFLRAARICYFKNVRKISAKEIVLVGSMETLHVIGLGLLTFGVIPQLNSVKSLMLTNCVCLIPGLLSVLPRHKTKIHSYLTKALIGLIAVIFQISGLLAFPSSGQDKKLWLIVPALILVSFRWWENYISSLNFGNILGRLVKLRENLTAGRYYMYLYIAPLKIFVFGATAFLVDGRHITSYFDKFSAGWKTYNISVRANSPIYTDRALDQQTQEDFLNIAYSPKANIWIFVILVVSSHICYIFAKFACKIKIQKFSFSFPLSIGVPVSLITLLVICGLRTSNPCIYNGYLPTYLFWKGPAFDSIEQEFFGDSGWVWILWLISQGWITRHIWYPRNEKNASTEKLFIVPFYCSFLIDQCILMNRRRFDDEDYVLILDSVTLKDPEVMNSVNDQEFDIRPTDKIPQIIICATMWHERREEMMEFFKSIIRLDEDQCARRMARKYYSKSKDPNEYDEEYYELETHIFFDDAFVLDPKLCGDPQNPPINDFVKDFLTSIEEAACKVFEAKIRIEPPTKIKTPYGGRLIWTLPGRTKMIAHLKNKSKIRNKKRWSQVMYMYYLLGYRIMQMDASPQRKFVIAQNTFLLALDGDIDFQPQAVQLLIGRMKVDADLGAACGRIHPVGKGVMVWYQIFEYAIGHWLQKATEHVIGCVLCSPGCFSLFRGRALMENSVMKKYTTESKEARHHVQYDQGEDRWLCTLLLKQKFRVEYSAASDAYTHSPEGFYEFYNQRRRWIPSTIANIIDLLSDAKMIVQNNNSISTPYIYYQMMLLVGTILGPGTIFLMMVGSLVSVFKIDIWTSFLWNFIPILLFMIMCYFCKQKYQLFAAFIISAFYSLVMMAVLIGIIIQVMDDGILSPASLFFFAVAAQIVITGCLHPQEVSALYYGIVYYITIPSMYMLLLIYSLFNLNDVSWGTRENVNTPNMDEDDNSKLPGWLEDPDLEDAKLESLSVPEIRFWSDLIKQYLEPIVPTEEAARKGREELRELRDIIIFAFLMINSLFVLVVFLLQINKSYLHIQWPFLAKNTIEFNDDTSEIKIFREYLQLEPIGLLFVLFFGSILALQFLAMLAHRFGTISQILAATELHCNCSAKDSDDENSNAERYGAAVTLAKRIQRPRKQLEDENSDLEEVSTEMPRHTIHRIIEERAKTQDWSNLEANFKRRYNKEQDLNLGGMSISRKTMKILENHRKSFIAERRNTIQSKNTQKIPTDYTYDNLGYTPSEYNNEEIELKERRSIKPSKRKLLSDNY